MMREDEAGTAAAEQPSKKGGLLVVIGALVVSLGAGGALGMTVLGPRLAAARATSATAADGENHAPRNAKGHGAAESSLFALESLVVNPAGTNGTRFLIVSLAVEPATPQDVEMLKAHEPEIRDRLLQVLAAKTVDQLSAIELRDTLKAEITAAINEAVPSTRIERLFMPQYVLQ